MPQRRIILLEAATLSAHLWRSGKLHEEMRIGTAAANIGAYSDYLRKHSTSIFYLLADVAEEGYVAESVPHVRGADRQAMLQRKLSQLYYGSPFAATVSLGRERSGRRDERVLFLALNRPQFLEPWLEAAHEAEAQIAGLYTVPFVAEQFVARLRYRSQRLLLLSIGRAGVRQIFFEDGRARFSRLTPIALGDVHDIAQACGTEAAKLHQYLISQRLVARAAPLPTLVLTHPSWQSTFAESCLSTEELRFDLVDITALGEACGLKTRLTDFIADPLFMHLLAQRQPSIQFAPAPERRFFQLWQTRSAITAAGAVIMLGCLLFSAKQFVEARMLEHDIASITKRILANQQSYRSLLASLPAMPTSLDNLRGVVGRYGELARRSSPPDLLLADISRTLDRMPEIELETVQWSLTSRPDEVGQAGAVKLPSAAESSAGQTSNVFVVAVISGALPTALAFDQRGQVETVDALVASLRHNPNLEVSVLRQPVDFESGKALRGGAEAEAARAPPRFSLRVSHRL